MAVRRNRPMPVNVKTYDGTGDPNDHLKIFQATAKIERVPRELLATKEIHKGPRRNHPIKQRERESTEAFMERFKAESMHVSGAPECMRISGFMYGITNLDLIKKLNDNIPKSIDEMMSVTTTFLRGEVAAANQSKKKASPTWKHYETGHKPNFDKRLDFKSQHKSSKRQDRFTPLTKTPKEILAMNIVKFKAPPPMIGPAENQNKNKFYEFYRDQGGKRGEQAKATKKEEAPNKEKDMAIFMVQPWQRITRQKTTQSFSAYQEISLSTLGNNNGHETPIVIEAKVECHLIHRMYVDGGSASEVLYEHFFNRLHPNIKQPNDSGNNPLLGFSSEISWPLGKISLMVTLGDEEHLTSILMNFMVVRSPSSYNGIIGRLGLRKIKAYRNASGVHDDNRSTGYLAAQRTNGRERNQSSNPPVVSGTIYMTGVPRFIVEHRLNVREGCQPIRRKRRGHAPDRNKAIQKEVAKLVEAKIMRKVHYHDWLSNPVMLNGKTGFSVRACHEEAEEILPSTPGRGVGLIFTSLEGEEFTYALRFKFDVSNNEAEHKALVAGLRVAEQMGVKNLIAKVDFCLVANQINGSYEAKEQSMTQRIEQYCVHKLRLPHQKSFSGNTRKILNRRDRILSNSVRRRVLLDDTAGRIPYGRGSHIRKRKAIQRQPIKGLVQKLNIKQRFAFVKHPQTNGQVERANRSLGEEIKARLGEDNRNWVEEVPHVLWVHRTMIKISNGDTPFSLTYGTESVIPVEIGMPSIRCAKVNQAENDEELLLNLDILKERREKQRSVKPETKPKWKSTPM
uniref:RNase H type-1 domain-containing protein n=1 Tax=Tanacetum cinerariifolium TaxID=118510 RepID=A0A6L2JCK8_TANCI|nr:hypothetical protein [Tanacetum cinerariifolium]